MGIFSKEDRVHNNTFTKPGTRGTFGTTKRYFMKVLSFFGSLIVFGVIYSRDTTGAILDMALQGHIGWFEAITQSLIKAMQYGTLKFPELLNRGFTLVSHGRIISAFIEVVAPFIFLFMSYYYMTSLVVDVLDGREYEVFRYWVIAVITLGVMFFTLGAMNGYAMMSGADVTFNKTEIINNINETGHADPLPGEEIPGEVDRNASINASKINMSVTNSTKSGEGAGWMSLWGVFG